MMDERSIVKAVRERLNQEGRTWDLDFEVSDATRPDGEWLEIFVSSNAHAKNRAAESQIISDVEAELTEQSGRELLLVRRSRLKDVA